jgi:DNA-binding HxlR family transcriptional regulator/putative sterol carrier protein
MATKRSYEDGCAFAHGLDLVGERWAMLVVRELILGPKRFTDLRAGLPGISPNVLTERLEELERVSIVTRRKLPPPAATWVYDLTDWGRELERVIMTLGEWAARSPVLPMGNAIGVDALILSFRTMFDPKSAEGLNTELELRLDGTPFHARIAGGKMKLDRGPATKPDVIVEADPNTLAGVVYGGLKIPDALKGGKLRLEGDRAMLKRFATLFPLPASAPATHQA